jgi:uncharacterized protein (TIGR03790 family)
VASLRVLTICLAFWLGTASAAAEDLSSRVLVVVNAKSEASARIGEYYAAKRGIPAEQVLRLSLLDAQPPDGIDRRLFETAIQGPIARWLALHQAQDRILFIVLTKGIPLRIEGGSQPGSAASVDSELVLLYSRLTGAGVPLAGPLRNPYFLGDRPPAEARRFQREDQQIYLVTRLDGYTVEDVLGLIDRGMTPSAGGKVVLDGKASWTDAGNGWLRRAAERLRESGLPDEQVVFDASAAVLHDVGDVLGYYSWGSNDPAIRRRTFGLRFRPGALAGMFVSTDARTLVEPPAGWTLGEWANKASWHRGSPQSLMGDLIREGVTGVAGHVAEPMLGNTIRPDVLFPAYFRGFTLAEAFYLAMPSLSWMNVVVGDPLCAPFSASFGERFSEVPGLDPSTGLPAVFSQRRLDRMAGRDAPRPAVALLLRAEVRAAQGDTAGQRTDLEQAVTLGPALLAARYQLASLLEASGEGDRAIEQYREILAISGTEAIALNNLAYALATRKGQLAEALELAERARKMAPRSAAVADTLGWIHFMRGDVRRAQPLVAEAARLAPDNAEIRVHLAQLHWALGDRAGASAALKEAIRLAPAIETTPAARELKSRLESPPEP